VSYLTASLSDFIPFFRCWTSHIKATPFLVVLSLYFLYFPTPDWVSLEALLGVEPAFFFLLRSSGALFLIAVRRYLLFDRDLSLGLVFSFSVSFPSLGPSELIVCKGPFLSLLVVLFLDLLLRFSCPSPSHRVAFPPIFCQLLLFLAVFLEGPDGPLLRPLLFPIVAAHLFYVVAVAMLATVVSVRSHVSGTRCLYRVVDVAD